MFSALTSPFKAETGADALCERRSAFVVREQATQKPCDVMHGYRYMEMQRLSMLL